MIPRILVVDDDDDLRRMIAVLLRSEGYQVVQAHNGEHALKELFSAPNIMVVDMVMPIMSGVKFLEEARDAGFATPAILMSAYDDVAATASELSVDYLAKPFDLETLLEKLEMDLPGARRPPADQCNWSIEDLPPPIRPLSPWLHGRNGV